MGQLQPLVDDLLIVGGIIDGRGGVGVLLYIRMEVGSCPVATMDAKNP